MLRKGPEHVPDSVVVLVLSIVLLLFSIFCSTVLVSAGEADDTLLTLITAVLGYVMYAAVLGVAGHLHRWIPTISSIMACGSILSVLMAAVFVLLGPFLGMPLVSLLALFILLWSVPVKGHIIARGIEQHWYVGIVIAMIVFIVQYAFQSTMTGRI